MDITEREDIEPAITHLQLAYAFHESSKLQQFIDNVSSTLCTDYGELFEISLDMLSLTADFFAINGNEEWYYQTSFFFSDQTMREYYRLVRTHARRHRLRFKKDPYFVNAQEYVFDTLFHHCRYNCWFRITTKSHHTYGCGLSVGIDEQFNGEFNLVVAVLDVMRYYQDAYIKLRDELSADARDAQIRDFPAPKLTQKEAA